MVSLNPLRKPEVLLYEKVDCQKKIPVKRPKLKILCRRVTHYRKAEWEGGHEKKELLALCTLYFIAKRHRVQGPHQ